MSRTRAKLQVGDPTPVTGGGRISARLLRPMPDSQTPPKNTLDKHIMRLLALHKDLPPKLQNVQLATMDVAAKRELLKSINHLLGVKPLRRRTHPPRRSGTAAKKSSEAAY